MVDLSFKKDAEASRNDGKRGNGKKQPSVYVLSLPGGGMHGILSLVGLIKLRELLETPTSEAFQVKMSASTGSIIAPSISINDPENPGTPLLNSRDALLKYLQQGKKIFPKIPKRNLKMGITGVIDLIRHSNEVDKKNELLIKDIREQIDLLRPFVNESARGELDKIHERIGDRWLLWHDRENQIQKLQKLHQEYPHLKGFDKLIDYTRRRDTSTWLKKQFTQASEKHILTPIYNHFASDIMFNHSVAQDLFRKTFRPESKLEDVLGSIVIFAHNQETRKAELFYKFNEDIFDSSPGAPAEISHPKAKIWDIVMASISNVFAFPRHKMEDGQTRRDHGTAYSLTYPLLMLKRKLPKDTQIKVVEFGTGYVDNVKDEFSPFAELLINGIKENMDHTRSLSLDSLKEIITEDNITIFNPRLSPRNIEEYDRFPSGDFTDASKVQMRRLVTLAREYYNSEEIDLRLKAIASEIAENLFILGKIDEDKYARILTRCGSENLYLDEDNVQNIVNEAQSSFSVKGIFRRLFPGKKDHTRALNQQDYSAPTPQDF